MKYALPGFILCWILLGASPAPAQSFKKGYRYYQKGDYPTATLIFERYRQHKKFAPAARYFNAKTGLTNTRDLPRLLGIDRELVTADSLYKRLKTRPARRLKRKYGVDTTAIADLRGEAQRWAIAWTRARGTLGALDSLFLLLDKPLPKIRPEMESARTDIVNAQLGSRDYDVMTAILRRYIEYVLPENYGQTRRMAEQIWPAFLEKYPPCDLNRFTADHPLTFAGRDCWREEVRGRLCSGDINALLDFHAQNRWTALEIVLLNAIADLRTDSAVIIDSIHVQRDFDLRRRNYLREQFRNGNAVKDTVAAFDGALEYISRYAPRYSAFRLMEESLQFFLEQRLYVSAIRLLEAARPYFPDTLPRGCNTNFDYQRRVKPWIDGKLPILRRPDRTVNKRPLKSLNTPEGDESSPVVSADGRDIWFAASGRPDNLAGQDVFYARRDAQTGDWNIPALVPELSGPGNQIPLSVTADGRQMLLFIHNRLYISRRSGAAWSAPEPLPVGGIAVLGKGCLSASGDTLILEGAYSAGTATTSPDVDLFVSVRNANTGEWSRPEALGADINTDLDETSPYLSPDGQTLWYVSTGYPGLGGSDVFMARRNGPGWARWTRPENMGKEINDTYPHRGFTTVARDGKKGWGNIAGELVEISW